MPTFSVVMAVYNKEPYLERSVKSVLNQNFSDFELICVDGTSSDGSYEALQNFAKKDSRLRVLRQENQGISAAKNKGIQNSKSELIVFIDADDEWKLGFLAKIHELTRKYNQASAYVTGYFCNFGGRLTKISIPDKSHDGLVEDYFKARMLGWGVHTSSVCIKKEALIKVGLFPILLASKKEKSTYLIDGNGKFIHKFNGVYYGEYFKRLNKEEVNIDTNLAHIEDLKIEIPGPGAEDQYTHDLIAITGKYAFANQNLSTWYGNIPGQDTKKEHSPIFMPIIGLLNNANLIIDKNLKIYLMYITLHAIDRIYLTKDINLIKYHNFHHIWGSFYWYVSAKKNVMKWFFRFNKYIYRSKFC